MIEVTSFHKYGVIRWSYQNPWNPYIMIFLRSMWCLWMNLLLPLLFNLLLPYLYLVFQLLSCIVYLNVLSMKDVMFLVISYGSFILLLFTFFVCGKKNYCLSISTRSKWQEYHRNEKTVIIKQDGKNSIETKRLYWWIYQSE